jgi:hypothetical protein
MERRYGKILITGKFIEETPEDISEIFSKLKSVVLRCEYLYDKDVFEYYLYSPLFDIVKYGEKAPLYVVKITVHYEDGKRIDFDVDVEKRQENCCTKLNPTMELLQKGE